MQKFLTQNFSLLLIIGTLCALFLPEGFFSFFNTYSAEILMTILFTSFLNLNYSQIFDLNYKKLFLYTFLYIVLIPLLFYSFFFSFLNPLYLTLFLIFFTLPSGMVNPAFTRIFNLNLLWATGFVVFTSLLFPFVFSFFSLIFSLDIQVSSWGIFFQVGKMIFIPFFLALLFQKFLQRATLKIITVSPSFSALGALLMMVGIISVNKTTFLQIVFSSELFVLGTAMVLAHLVFAIIAYFLPSENKQEKWTNILIFTSTNPLLFLVMSEKFFPPEIFVGAFFAEICWLLFHIIFASAHRKWYSSSIS